MACDLLFTCLWSYAILYKMSDTFLVSDSSFCRKASHFSELQIEEFLLEARKDEELRFVFRVSDGRWGYTDYDPRLYGALKEQFIPETEDINENYIVNFAWAVDRLSD